MGVNVGQILREPAVRQPARVGIVHRVDGERRTATYGALDDGARRVAAALQRSGSSPGDRVLLCAGNHPGFVEGFFGALYAGCTVVPAPILSTRDELAVRIEATACRVALCDEPRLERVEGLGAEVLPIAWARGADAIPHPVPQEPGADALILFTSGTTGVAKGACISHASLLLHTATLVHHTLLLETDDRVLGVLPLTHSFGCRMALLAPFFAGAAVVLEERFDAAHSFALLAEEPITWAPVVPTILTAWGRLEETSPPPSLRWVLSAGAPLPGEVACRAEHQLGVSVRQGYGLTEATFSTVDGPPGARTLGSVGRPVWGVEVRVVDELGAALAPGVDGEIEVRGHNQMSGYLGDPDATAAALRDGWLRTGDLGHLDEEGRLYVVDRRKDLILRGGNNVFPAEVEAVLCSHPGVAEVAVVGRPDPYYGEEVVAVVVPRAGATLADLGTFAAARLSRVKVPRELAVVERLPVGPSGKIRKRELRDQLERGLLVPEKLALPREG